MGRSDNIPFVHEGLELCTCGRLVIDGYRNRRHVWREHGELQDHPYDGDGDGGEDIGMCLDCALPRKAHVGET